MLCQLSYRGSLVQRWETLASRICGEKSGADLETDVGPRGGQGRDGGLTDGRICGIHGFVVLEEPLDLAGPARWSPADHPDAATTRERDVPLQDDAGRDPLPHELEQAAGLGQAIGVRDLLLSPGADQGEPEHRIIAVPVGGLDLLPGNSR